MDKKGFEKLKHFPDTKQTPTKSPSSVTVATQAQQECNPQYFENDSAKTFQTDNRTTKLAGNLCDKRRRQLLSMRVRTLSEGLADNDNTQHHHRPQQQQSKKALRSILKTNTLSNNTSKQCSLEQPSVDKHNVYGDGTELCRKHRSLSMLFNNNKNSVESAPGDITLGSNVRFAPNRSDAITNVLFYDPNQSAHDSVLSGRLPPNTNEHYSNKTKQDSCVLPIDNHHNNDDDDEDNDENPYNIHVEDDVYVDTENGDIDVVDDDVNNYEREHLLSSSQTKPSAELKTHFMVPNNGTLLEYPSTPIYYPHMKICELKSGNNYAAESVTPCCVPSPDDDPWYCDQCETWFGSPDPSYPEHCRCVDSTITLKRENSKIPLSKSDTLSSNDTASIYSQTMHKDFRYYFQHPILRCMVAFSVIFCNFLIYSEDPISHSERQCSLPIVGNVLSFIFAKHPPELGWLLIKISLNFSALILGATVGKYLIHGQILTKWARIKMFRDDSGTWMVMGFGIIAAEYFFSQFYNLLLLTFHSVSESLLIDSFVGINFSVFMKLAACGTWLGDFSTAWMIIDMMLQDNLYPYWARTARRFWHEKKCMRIIIFWIGGFFIAGSVIIIIQFEWLCWDCVNYVPISTNELSRSFLASLILLQDLVIVMQDWDFPHFVTDLNIKLPGLLRPSYTFGLCGLCQSAKTKGSCEIKISGKWFNYGIILMVMMFDLNMWKNQIIYSPQEFGQYVHPQNRRIFVVRNAYNVSDQHFSWQYRASNIDPNTGRSFMDDDMLLKSEYHNYPSWIKALSFIPIAIGFASFFSLIYLYGRFPPKTDRSIGGRLIKRSSSNWQRERNQSRTVSKSHYWSNILSRNRARNFMARVSDRASQFGPMLRFASSSCSNSNSGSNSLPNDHNSSQTSTSSGSSFSIWSYVKFNKHNIQSD